MPYIPVGDQATLRTYPQSSKLYMVVQQPARYQNGAYLVADFVWYGRIRSRPADDPQLELAVEAAAASPGATIKDGMTILVSSEDYGLWDRVVLSAHGDQTVLFPKMFL